MSMEIWTLANAKRDFRIGYLEEFWIDRAVLGAGWQVRLKGGARHGWLVDARSQTPRIFQTLEAAVSSVEKIGFKVISLGRC